MRAISFLTALALSLCASQSFAQWQLNNEQSKLSFVSIKAADVGEVHHFTSLAGLIDDHGATTVAVSLASVETFIPSRNDRMRKFLFETELFPIASINAQLSTDDLQNLAVGTSQSFTVDASLDIKDKKIPLQANVVAMKLSANSLYVVSEQPILVTAASFGLTDGVEKLRELAGLPSISQAVPVSFVFHFDRLDEATKK